MLELSSPVDLVNEMALIQIPVYSIGLVDSIHLILQKLYENLWAISHVDTGYIHPVLPIKTQVNYNNPLLNIKQYPLNSEVLAGIQ